MKTVSVAKILDVAGGAAGLRRMMEQAGQPAPTANSIALWVHRDRVAGVWTAPVIWALVRETNVDPLELMVDAEMTARELADELGL